MNKVAATISKVIDNVIKVHAIHLGKNNINNNRMDLYTYIYNKQKNICKLIFYAKR